MSNESTNTRSPLHVTLLNQFDYHGGAERCVIDLLHGLNGRNHRAKLLFGRRGRDNIEPATTQLNSFLPEYILQRGSRYLFGLTDTLMLSPIWQAKCHPKFVEADIVHIHGLAGSYFNLWALPIIAKRCPLVVTLHDMWLLTGDCDHSGECSRWETTCGNCPLISRPRAERGPLGGADLTKLNLAIKRKVFDKIPVSRLTITVPSQWLANKVSRSYLARFPIRVIQNGVDLTAYAPLDRRALRESNGISLDKFILAAIAGNWSNPHKGGELLLQLANNLAVNSAVKLIVAGKMNPTFRSELIANSATVLDGVQTADVIRNIFNTADASLMLSKHENLPYIVSESLACGCPVIACPVGGVPEMITSGESGWLLSKPADLTELLGTVVRLAHADKETLDSYRQSARAEALRRFDRENMILSFESIYFAAIEKIKLECRSPKKSAA